MIFFQWVPHVRKGIFERHVLFHFPRLHFHRGTCECVCVTPPSIEIRGMYNNSNKKCYDGHFRMRSGITCVRQGQPPGCIRWRPKENFFVFHPTSTGKNLGIHKRRTKKTTTTNPLTSSSFIKPRWKKHSEISPQQQTTQKKSPGAPGMQRILLLSFNQQSNWNVKNERNFSYSSFKGTLPEILFYFLWIAGERWESYCRSESCCFVETAYLAEFLVLNFTTEFRFASVFCTTWAH